MPAEPSPDLPPRGAEARKTLRAAGIDFAVAAVVALLLWPFPLVRLTLGIPWAVHGPLIVAWVLLVYLLYLAVCASLWGRSAAMYLLDLGLAPRSSATAARRSGFGKAFAWAAGWTLALLPAALGARSLSDPRSGLPARLSGLETVASPTPTAR